MFMYLHMYLFMYVCTYVCMYVVYVCKKSIIVTSVLMTSPLEDQGNYL